MAIKKIEIVPNQNDYRDILYPKTSADIVITSNGQNVETELNNKSDKDHNHDTQYISKTINEFSIGKYKLKYNSSLDSLDITKV